jgi:hypothetical protein
MVYNRQALWKSIAWISGMAKNQELCHFPDGADKGLIERVFTSNPLYLLRSLPVGALMW